MGLGRNEKAGSFNQKVARECKPTTGSCDTDGFTPRFYLRNSANEKRRANHRLEKRTRGWTNGTDSASAGDPRIRDKYFFFRANSRGDAAADSEIRRSQLVGHFHSWVVNDVADVNVTL